MELPVKESSSPDIKRLQDSAKRYEVAREFRLGADYRERAANLFVESGKPREAIKELKIAIADLNIVKGAEKRESRVEEIKGHVMDLDNRINELAGKGPSL